jgi:FkbM family methyltransferase
MNFKVEYGVETSKINVTELFFKNVEKRNNIYIIPSIDNKRGILFNGLDPAFGVIKNIYISIDNIRRTFNAMETIYIDIDEMRVYSDFDDNIPEKILIFSPNYEAVQKLKKIQNKIKLYHGSFYDEYPEQLMIAKFINGSEKILEIGGNIGRSSLIISHILNLFNNDNLVTLECDRDSCLKLNENKNVNNSKFFIENSALSKRKLIQKGWDTIPSDILLPGYKNINIISFDEIQEKYNITFDTLVLDCEGAFYYILNDFPEMLNNIKLIIVENDYNDLIQKNYVDNILKINNFKVIYTESGYCGVCKDNFYEVWKK